MNRLEAKGHSEHGVVVNSGLPWRDTCVQAQVASADPPTGASVMIRNTALATVVALANAAWAAQSPTPNPVRASDPNPWLTQPGKRVFRCQFADPPSGSPAQVFAVLNPTGPSCPVTMRAEHRGGGSAIDMGSGPATAIGQRIHPVLGELSARVAAATVTVRGTNG